MLELTCCGLGSACGLAAWLSGAATPGHACGVAVAAWACGRAAALFVQLRDPEPPQKSGGRRRNFLDG